MPTTILIVEDDADLAATVAYALRREGFTARVARNGHEALEVASRDPVPDLVLLDLMLPDLPGTEICRRLRAGERTRHIPVVMVTARADEIDRVVGFEVGADDYVAKPFSVRELMLRIRAVLRRAQPAHVTAPALVAGLIRIDRDAHRAWIDGEEVGLTALEFRLLALLVERRGRVQTRERLLQDVWDVHAEVTTRTVDTHVKRLRQKIGLASELIETLRGVGYRLRAEGDEPS